MSVRFAIIACWVLLAILSPLALLAASEGPSARERVRVENGHIIVEPARDPGPFAARWPATWEAEYRQRVDHVLRLFAGKSDTRTHDEAEKASLPLTIGAFFAGDMDQALAAMHTEDLQAESDHAHTEGIDLYWSFTLKGQATRFFDFQHDLQPEYRDRFARAMDLWTRSDPRPSLEYVLNLDSPYPEVRAFAREQLTAMWRDADALREMASQAEAEGHPNKQRFAEFIRRHADTIAVAYPGDDVQAWREWWAAIAAGDWMIFEEYERRVNPNPHPRHGIGSGPVGDRWNPSVRGMRADARNTDNLRAMREVMIYLAAEHSGNDTIRLVYKDRLRRVALAYWNVGNGEWDSEGYHGHSQAAFANLFAYAKDDEVRGYAKAILDYLFTSSAMKYYRGAWGGPGSRDYGNIDPFSTAASVAWLYFGDAPQPPGMDHEFPFLVLSGYRPPAAVVALARKEFPRSPAQEVFATRPHYSNWLPGADEQPLYFETIAYGPSWQMGSLDRGHRGDVNGFKLLVSDAERGASYIIPSTGRLRNPAVSNAGGDNVGQWGSSALWINGRDNSVPFHFVVPRTATVHRLEGDLVVLETEQVWVGLLPWNLQWKDGAAIAELRSRNQPHPAQGLIAAQGGGGLSGFALEVAERSDFATLGDFTAYLQNASLAAGPEAESMVFTTADGRQLRLDHAAQADGGPRMWRNGEVQERRFDLWRAATEDGPIHLGWKRRSLQVRAGGHRFTATLEEDGTYRWQED